MSLLVLHCGGPFTKPRGPSKTRKCTSSIQVPFGTNRDDLTAAIAVHGWIVSLVTSKSEPEPACDVLCPTCAPLIHGEQLYRQALAVIRGG